LEKIVKIGCCGFQRSRREYYKRFNVVELQNTFYQLPSIDWAEKLRGEAPEGFEFTIKAWQVITHPSTSPTWRRMKKKPGGNLDNYGFLKPTRENLDAVEKVVEIAEKLGSTIIIFQTPASMPYDEESIKWVDGFFEHVTTTYTGILFGWEPRGGWSRHDDVLYRILSKHGVLHVVDVFKRKPVFMGKGIFYTRLHGIGPRETNYRYKYTDDDLARLAGMLDELGFSTGYVMFNNIYMFDDAWRFKEILRGRSGYRVL
jgi:uncharacterized protein YecE (DUF72 family)